MKSGFASEINFSAPSCLQGKFWNETRIDFQSRSGLSELCACFRTTTTEMKLWMRLEYRAYHKIKMGQIISRSTTPLSIVAITLTILNILSSNTASAFVPKHTFNCNTNCWNKNGFHASKNNIPASKSSLNMEGIEQQRAKVRSRKRGRTLDWNPSL